MIGTRASPDACARIDWVAAYQSMRGIWKSITMASYVVRAAIATASSLSDAISTL